MATIKAVVSHSHLRNIINYVTKKEKTETRLLSGICCNPETAYDDMMFTKSLWNKNNGVQYYHYVQSFAPQEKITPDFAHKIAIELAEKIPQWQGHEILLATHKDRPHIHTHFIVNSVNLEKGNKLHFSPSDLRDLKAKSDEILRKYGLSITKKGFTFEGMPVKEYGIHKRSTYKFLLKATVGKVQSYVQRIAMAVNEAKDKAVSRADFISILDKQNIDVKWEDNLQYITFTDRVRRMEGEKKCKIRNNTLQGYYNLDLSKEVLTNGFAANAEFRAAEQLVRNYERTHMYDYGIDEGKHFVEDAVY